VTPVAKVGSDYRIMQVVVRFRPGEDGDARAAAEGKGCVVVASI
jgi:hypothetical protein